MFFCDVTFQCGGGYSKLEVNVKSIGALLGQYLPHIESMTCPWHFWVNGDAVLHLKLTKMELGTNR